MKENGKMRREREGGWMLMWGAVDMLEKIKGFEKTFLAKMIFDEA